MVLQKRSNYGSSGYQVAAMVHFPRSAKGKRSIRRKIEENQMCAFDLLATVAGKLLEGESIGRASSPTTAKLSVKQEQSYKLNTVKAEAFEDGCFNSKERSPTPKTVSGHASVLINCDASYKYGSSRKSIINGGRDELVISPGLIAGKCVQGFPHGPKESCEFKVEDGIKTPRRAERMSGDLIDSNGPGSCSLEDPMDMDSKPPALVSSDSSVEVPLIRDRLGMKLAVNRDDDENSSGCTHASTSKAFKNQRIGDRRIRKLLASKFWKVAPTMFKDAELSDTERKPVLRGRKLCYTRQRTQRCTYKRRKLFERYTASPSDGVLCGEGPSNSPKTGSIKVEPGISQSKLHAETGAFSPTSGKDPSYESGDFEVKFSIKSFKVPELFIEIPKTATVGSLKRTVMDAVTAALGGGLRVGVYLQGKKVKCDSKTLLQAGISHTDELDNLDFTLEPSANQAPLTEDPQFILPCDTTVPLTSTPAAIPPNQGASNGTMGSPVPLVNSPESDHDSVQSPTGLSSPDKAAGISMALVPVWVPAEKVKPLSVVPPPRKGRRSDLIQRRIRRPFSVTEVEALVQAVEKLGTGRWRDVKIRAFDNAKHRTYVDLKDKWKTLVHTARISPQQRRGEPVPQELLDRVLAAHAHWTQQQAKFQVKPSTSTEEPPLLLV